MTQATPTSPPLDAVAGTILALGGPNLLALAQAHRRRQVTLSYQARNVFRRLWRFVDPANPQASWATASGRAVGIMSAAQQEAARGADEYVVAALAHQGASADLAGALVASSLAGIAADGRDLSGLLSYPAFEVSAFIDQGMDHGQALAIGQRHLDRIVATEVSDAARVGTGVAVASDRKTKGYIRMLGGSNPCSRCIILAGRWYRWNAGFERHPQCSCVHIPAAEDVAGDVSTDPKAYFDSLSKEEQNQTFGKAGAQAIRDGADLSRTVNARRGMYEAGGKKYTTEATTRRGTGKRVRLMPEQIYKEANGNREEAIRLLRLHGYLR